MLLLIFVAVLFSILSYSFFFPEPEPILNLYRKKGRWYYLKYVFARCFLYICKNHPFHQMKSSNLADPKKFAEAYDCTQPLADSPWGFDAVFFMAANSDGFYFVIGVERRNNSVSNCLFYVVVPGLGLLENIEMPNTALYPAEEGTYNVKGFHISVVEPMKKWMIAYDGDMRMENGKRRNVHFKGTFSSDQPYFSFDTDLHSHVLAHGIALEPWSKQYFETLKEHQQNHYEQIGILEASLTIDGTNISVPSTPTYRDHSFGKQRNWNLMHRYSMFMLFLENGYFVEVGVVCQPGSFSELFVGYVSDCKGIIDPLEWTDLKIYQHGELGKPPIDIAFQFKAGGNLYTAQAETVHRGQHLKGFNRQIKMFESFVRCRVNGVPGVGISEFSYSNVKVRETEISSLLEDIKAQ
nr:PREDICTED: uncharacterized protein LOC109044058 [Bemisia tabaci]